MSPSQSLDHLILFLPVDATNKLPAITSFIKENFTLTPGGFHADGATSNTLILLSDGCYIELISFVDPSAAPSHWWGPDVSYTGWKDWCLTNSLSPEENWEKLGGKEGSHGEPVRGGRKRADGIEVKWAVTFPWGEKGGQDIRGRVPFFCHDVTDRQVRVPLDEEKTTHACGALGVRELSVVVNSKELFSETRKVYSRIVGNDGVESGDEIQFEIGRVQGAAAINDTSKIVLRLARSEEEAKRMNKFGYWYGDIVLGAQSSQKNAAGTKKRLDDGSEDVGGIWVEYE